MIELNSKTQQDFLNREWVQRLLDAGVNMSDAKYCIVKYHNYDVVFYKNSIFTTSETVTSIIPTYTVSELLYKLQNLKIIDINAIECCLWLNNPIEAFASLLIQLHEQDSIH